MTKYREIIRLKSLDFSERNIATSIGASRNTVSKVAKRAKELNLRWPLPNNFTDCYLEEMMFPKEAAPTGKRLPDLSYIRKELLRNGVTKKLLWTEYLEDCHLCGDVPLMYSQFCHYIHEDEQKRRATMHINRKPAEQVEVDWAGDKGEITDPDTGEIIDVHIFVGVMAYSLYAFAEAFINEKQKAWITAHVHMFEYFGGVAKILVSDNCKTAVIHNSGWYNQQVNATYYEMAEHYGTAIMPARVLRPKDKPNAEGGVNAVNTLIASLRNGQFFSLAEFNRALRDKLGVYNRNPFQKKEGSRSGIFRNEEQHLLLPLPTTPYELAEWKTATVQFNYHISIDQMLYSVPHEYIKKKVDVRVTDKVISVYINQDRIATHLRLHGRKGQYSTIPEHMPPNHQRFLEWDGDRFRKWAKQIGHNTYLAVEAILASRRVEQQAYRGCMGLLKLADKYSAGRLEEACKKALTYTASPSYKSIQNLIGAKKDTSVIGEPEPATNQFGITRGAGYYGGKTL